MPASLKLFNTFKKTLNHVELNGSHVSVPTSLHPTQASLYICGPTVYSDSHLGHAVTYIRADLFRRFMISLFNVDLVTVMNITDIDDKILVKAEEEKHKSNAGPSSGAGVEHPFTKVSERYYKSFKDDMRLIRVLPPDLSIKVSKQVPLISKYIKKLEQTGHAYPAPSGDIYFRVSTVNNYVGRVDNRKDNIVDSSLSKTDPRDFVLWKAAKPGEPIWMHHSFRDGKVVPGRPGWHVQCSAISNAIFGSSLDFHYGGNDLVFPHHYNEEACCCAYHNLNTDESIHVWSKNWLHSGHLVMKTEKMSKSIGNVVPIRDFVDKTSVNAIRLLCVESHYRSNVDFNQELLDQLKSLDHKFSAFSNYIADELKNISNNNLSCQREIHDDNTNMHCEIAKVRSDIFEGVCDDFDLKRGMDSILDLTKIVYNRDTNSMEIRDLMSIQSLLMDWFSSCGLEYTVLSENYDATLIEIVQAFRLKIRTLAISEIKNRKGQDSKESHLAKSLLNECDSLRANLDDLGYVLRDEKT